MPSNSGNVLLEFFSSFFPSCLDFFNQQWKKICVNLLHLTEKQTKWKGRNKEGRAQDATEVEGREMTGGSSAREENLVSRCLKLCREQLLLWD